MMRELCRAVKRCLVLACCVSLVFSSCPSWLPGVRAQSGSAAELAGLWEARRRFGAEVGGELIIRQLDDQWRAEIASRTAMVQTAGDAISFALPDGKGSFQGKLDARRTRISGHWTQPATMENGTAYASPVTLVKDRRNVWRGEVSPLDDTMTFYLMIKPRADGSVGAFLRNPERNLGRFMRVDAIERQADSVRLLAAGSANEKGRVLAEGKYYGDPEMLSLYFASRGSTFDFRRVRTNEASDFYPRGHPSAPYRYTPPPALEDGWQTATLESVGISRARMERFIQMLVETPMDGVGAPEVHGVLVARHGRLVLEEYFHGEHRARPHDTRSAAKSLAATMVGASIKAGLPLKVSSPVYQLMHGGAFPTDLEARKKALTVEHLLTMSSGLDCDDGDPKSSGNEDNMLEQTEQPDYYQFTLGLKMVRQPGERAVYCSGQSNLLGGVLKRAAGEPLTVLFHKLIAEPLQIRRYYMNLMPTGDAYMAGGVRFLPRDFMKLGQLHLNGGTWNGRTVLTPEWVRRATSRVVNMERTLAYNWAAKRMETGTRQYGYLWWVEDYPYHGRTVKAFFAGGNGGQLVVTVPELHLVVAFYGGNYGDRAGFLPQWVYLPQHILPAIDD